VVASGYASQQQRTLLERLVAPKVSYQYDYLGNAALSGETTSVTTQRQQLTLNNEIASLQYGYTTYQWYDLQDLSFGNGVDAPINQIHSIKLAGRYPFRPSERWFWLSSLNLNMEFEDQFEGSLGVGFFSFGSYKIDADHTVQMGLFGNYHPVASIILPVISYSYRARQSEGFQAVLGFPRTYVGYRIKEKLLLSGGLIYSQAVVKLGADNGLTPGGYLETKDYFGNLGATYDLTKHWQAEVNWLYALRREFTRYDSSEVELGKETIKPSSGIMLKLRYLFED
jgi:hypothetical protein